jgi:hypothetical protein
VNKQEATYLASRLCGQLYLSYLEQAGEAFEQNISSQSRRPAAHPNILGAILMTGNKQA